MVTVRAADGVRFLVALRSGSSLSSVRRRRRVPRPGICLYRESVSVCLGRRDGPRQSRLPHPSPPKQRTRFTKGGKLPRTPEPPAAWWAGCSAWAIVEDYVRFFQRAFAAFLAMDTRRAAESFLARAFPPFRPPRRPSATAAWFFWESICRVAVSAAISFTLRFFEVLVRLLKRLGIDATLHQ